MLNFHDHKLWQDAYVVLMDIHGAIDNLDAADDKAVVEGLLTAAQFVAAKIADGLSRKDHRHGSQLIYDAVGLVAVARTQLAVAWGRGLLNDEAFRGLDDKYAQLSESLQQYR